MGAVKSKTMWFAFALVVLGFVQTNLPAFQALVPTEFQGLFAMVVGLIVAALRMQTDTALSDK